MRSAAAPLLSETGSLSSSIHFLTRRLLHHHHCRRYLFVNFACPQLLPLPRLYRESAKFNRQQPPLFFRTHRVCEVSTGRVEAEDETNGEACELVSGTELSIGEGVDSVQAYLFKAVKNNNGTGILLLPDVFGFEDSSTRDFAYRVACNGYNVLVPDLFRGDPWTKKRPEASFEAWLSKHNRETVAEDIKTCMKWMMDEFVAAGMSSKKLGVVGFCFGGARVIDVLAQDQGSCFGIGVSFDAAIVDPSVVIENVKVPMLFIMGDKDPFCPTHVIEDIVKRIGERCKMMVFNGRGHGFVHRPESREEDRDAEHAFMVLRDWLHDGLVAGT